MVELSATDGFRLLVLCRRFRLLVVARLDSTTWRASTKCDAAVLRFICSIDSLLDCALLFVFFRGGSRSTVCNLVGCDSIASTMNGSRRKKENLWWPQMSQGFVGSKVICGPSFCPNKITFCPWTSGLFNIDIFTAVESVNQIAK